MGFDHYGLADVDNDLPLDDGARNLVEPAPGPFVISVTAMLIVSAIAYMALLEVMLGGHVEQKKRK